MKMRVHEYCACIGFTGNKAVVNKRAAKLYKSYSVRRFIEEGQFKQAFAMAYYLGDEAQMELVTQAFRHAAAEQGGELPGRSTPSSTGDMQKLYGCIPSPQDLGGILYV